MNTEPSRPPSVARHLSQTELSRRWHLSTRTLEQWRWKKTGPQYWKAGRRVLYSLDDIEAYEAAQRRRPGADPFFQLRP
jgi:hypothetical protein